MGGPDGQELRPAFSPPDRLTAAFDPEHVPAPLRVLLDLARRWGVSDDGHRWRMVSTASRADLDAMVRTVDNVDVDLVDGWLAGPEADAEEPSIEYVAVSALFMAADQARLVLEG